MKDYSKVTHIDYIKKRKEMFQSLGYADGSCNGVDCSECPLDNRNSGKDCGCSEFENPLYAIKAVMEFEPPVDWTKVPVDTKVLVSSDGEEWHKRYFSNYDGFKVWCFYDGRTSFTTLDKNHMNSWKYSKLYKESEEE